MSKSTQVLAIFALFGMLSASAATGFPRAFFDVDLPRGMRTLDWIVGRLGTDHFGASGGAMFFALLGALFVGFVLAKPGDKQRSAPRKSTGLHLNEPAQRTASASQEQPANGSGAIAARRTRDLAKLVTAAGVSPPPPAASKKTGEPRPAWGLMMVSPWARETEYTSWLGGVPKAPQEFAWPRDSEDGEPMHFYAQIDLASLAPEPETGRRAPGLPNAGAMLVFIGHGCAVHIVGAEEMARAQPVPPPPDLPSLRKFGYWVDGSLFPKWPITPKAFLDHPYDEEIDEQGPPAAFPDPHGAPQDWISNWGMAALEAGVVITALKNDIRNSGQWPLDYQMKKLAEAGGPSDTETLREKAMASLGPFQRLLLTEGPSLLAEMERWKASAESQDPMQPVDASALAQLFEKRRAFSAKEQRNFASTIALRGAAHEVWQEIWFANRGGEHFASLRAMPEAYRQFAEERITGWRRHRLFGIEPPFPNNWEDLGGKACLVSIGADPLIDTQTEHEYGLSLWGPVEDLERGRFDRLEVVRHCAV